MKDYTTFLNDCSAEEQRIAKNAVLRLRKKKEKEKEKENRIPGYIVYTQRYYHPDLYEEVQITISIAPAMIDSYDEYTWSSKVTFDDPQNGRTIQYLSHRSVFGTDSYKELRKETPDPTSISNYSTPDSFFLESKDCTAENINEVASLLRSSCIGEENYFIKYNKQNIAECKERIKKYKKRIKQHERMYLKPDVIDKIVKENEAKTKEREEKAAKKKEKEAKKASATKKEEKQYVLFNRFKRLNTRRIGCCKRSIR